MPRQRGKANKACQTDTVYLSEDQVEKIVSQHTIELKSALESLQSELNILKSAQKKLSEDCELLNDLQQGTDAQVEQLQESLESVAGEDNSLRQNNYKWHEENKDTLKKMRQNIDDVEQIHKMNNLRIAGLEEEDDEDVQAKVIGLAKDLNTKLEPKDIIEVQRMGRPKQNQTRDILIKFANHQIRNALYQNRKRLQHTRSGVYMNEDLTQGRSKLFYEARKLRKQGRIFGAWSQHGNILIKIVEHQSQPRAVSCYNDIAVLMEKCREVTSTSGESSDEIDSQDGTDIELGDV